MVSTPPALAIIPARGGSKSIPRKNIRSFGGQPLIAWTIAAARQASSVERVIVSTDDPDIADLARRCGAEVPFLRPSWLAEDDTLDLPVFEHAVRWLDREDGYTPEIIVHLRPTSPLRPLECVDRAIHLLAENPSADSVRAVTPSGQNPFKMWRTCGDRLAPLLDHIEDEPYNLPRQSLPATYWQTGHVDAVRRATLLEAGSMTGRTILPLFIDPEYAVDLDTPLNWQQGEWLLGHAGLTVVRPPPVRDLSGFRILVLDFDGVLTDNRVQVLENGTEAVTCSRADGLGLAALRAAGFPVFVLSTETNGVVSARCEKLGIRCERDLDDKPSALRRVVAEEGVTMEQVIFVGNDRNDLGCLELAGLAVVPSGAHPEAVRSADWILSRAGGLGAVRELCDLLMEAQTK
ncbi:MAG: HAD hydrolase family protein [Gemmatimonas sp.]|nr:HAD hydrolase family protein [Gemmatimonas sp.]